MITSLLLAEGLAQLGCGIGAGIDAIARQPEASGKIFSQMILTAAFVEGCALFAIAACAFLIK